MHSDINNHPEIILSFIKEYLKFVNMKDPQIMIDYYYSTNTNHTLERIYSFIDKLCIGDDHKKYLKSINQYSMAE
jgi:tagatose-1,6-bisphosphate aldolase non-catalytic subunit AgaZ/GatZ